MVEALQTDLYQLTMMAGYWAGGMLEPATFELYVRRMPPSRGYLIAAGLEQALEYLERVRFDADTIGWLKGLPPFARVPAAFFDDYLASLRFTGDVWAVPEGTPVAAQEPLVRVTAPLPEAQFVETALLAAISYQTSVASKASRTVEAAAGRSVVEFGARRAHGTGAALLAARAAYIGGCDGTSYVEAARRFDIPASGTMAHSWVQAHASEADAFASFADLFADAAVYLLDTYDTIAAAAALVDAGLRPAAVRIDSGDLAQLSRQVRQILDRGGLTATRIIATSDLDEHRIAALVASGAPIDAFGVGTALSVVNDAPALSAVYKLVEVTRSGHTAGVVKLSLEKETWPGPKQVWRAPDGDLVAAVDEPAPPGSVPLLQPVMRNGQRLTEATPLTRLRWSCRRQVSQLPVEVRRLHGARSWPVRHSEALARHRGALIDARPPVGSRAVG